MIRSNQEDVLVFLRVSYSVSGGELGEQTNNVGVYLKSNHVVGKSKKVIVEPGNPLANFRKFACSINISRRFHIRTGFLRGIWNDLRSALKSSAVHLISIHYLNY